jgi:Cof subfamily protein (haloacid dehalogenase superfamily)
MNYKLLVLDVDGTLLNSNHEVSRRTLSTLIKVQQTGIRIVLASGRPPYGLKAIVNQLELPAYGGFVIAYNGSQIIDAASGEVIFERRVNPEIVPYLEKKALKNNFPIFTYTDNRIVTNVPDNDHIQAEAKLNGLDVVYEPEFSTSIDFNPYKVVLVSDEEEALVKLTNLWKRRLNGTVEAHRSEDYFLEILPYGVDKSGALSVLLEHLKINRQQVVAFGDGVRDVGLLQMSGIGVAMANARDSVKACADQVTTSCDEDGVAQAIESFIISKMQTSSIPLGDLNRQSASSLMGNLGISYTFASPSRVEATMPVDQRTRQPFGILHGGASLALAETVAGLGSMILAKPDEDIVGMQISGNHISSAHEGDTVRAVATIVHAGRSSHVWNVDIFTSTGKLVSTVRVVNCVMKKN